MVKVCQGAHLKTEFNKTPTFTKHGFTWPVSHRAPVLQKILGRIFGTWNHCGCPGLVGLKMPKRAAHPTPHPQFWDLGFGIPANKEVIFGSMMMMMMMMMMMVMMMMMMMITAGRVS